MQLNAPRYHSYQTIFKVESVQIHKDRKGESKGIAYVKFSKTSEAALAVEEMNGRCIGHHPRPLKVQEFLRQMHFKKRLFHIKNTFTSQFGGLIICSSGNGSPC